MNNVYGYYYANTTKCTRITNETSTLIDHMLTNNPDKIKKSGVLEVCMGDHYMNYMVWKSCHLTTHNHKNVTFRKCNGINWELFREDLRRENLNEIETIDDLDDAVKKWEDIVMRIIDKHMPWKTKRMRKKCSPWMNESIYKLMRQRDKIKKQAIAQKSEQLWKKYRQFRNKVTSVIRKAKKLYYVEKLSKRSNRNESWNILKSFLPNKGSSNLPCDDSHSKASEFNNHFANVAPDLLREHECTETDSSVSPKPVSFQSKFEFTVVSETEVLRELQKLKNKKSVGIDGISVQTLKSCADILIKPITHLINRSLMEGKVPKAWKVAKIIPLHKKGDKSNPDNYRPISLLPCISKLLERMVQLQLVHYLQTNNILVQAQSGFRANHSTVTALVKVTDEWLIAMDGGKYTGVIYIDLKKAFDTVDHDILLSKLSQLGVKHVTLQWFKSYLTERKIVTKVNDAFSEERVLTHGVPQGSLLGPLLFCIFINDLPSIFTLCNVHLYADDTVIYFADKNVNIVESVLNKEMEVLDKWMSKNKLLINYNKTVSMLLGTQNMLSKCDALNIQIRKINIKKVETTKYLGLHIDSRLKWDIHVNNMCQKISKMVNFLGRLRYIINELSLNMIYKSIILPHFDYGDVVWQSAPSSYLSPLQKLQNRAGRIIMRINPHSHTSNQHIHETLTWDYLDCRYKKHLCTMVYKTLNNLFPIYMSENITKRTSNYVLRSNQNLHLPKPNSNNCKRTFFYRGISEYNQLPIAIRNAPTTRSFQNLLNACFN